MTRAPGAAPAGRRSASAAAGGLALFAGGQTWATLSAVRPEPLPPVTGVLTGSAYAPLVPAAGLVLLAAAVALLAVRGRRTGRRRACSWRPPGPPSRGPACAP